MCEWLGPYEESVLGDIVAPFYKQYFEERLSYLLLTLALLLRTLDERNLIGDATKREEPRNIDLGQELIGKQWQDIGNFRNVLNLLIHAVEVIQRNRVEERRVELGISGVRNIESRTGWIHIVGKANFEPQAMRLNLRAFCDMVFRVVEQLPTGEGS